MVVEAALFEGDPLLDVDNVGDGFVRHPELLRIEAAESGVEVGGFDELSEHLEHAAWEGAVVEAGGPPRLACLGIKIGISSGGEGRGGLSAYGHVVGVAVAAGGVESYHDSGLEIADDL